jgi:hypothetical protein
MRSYPPTVATKQDFENLLAMPEHRERALAELRAIYDLQDDTLTIDESPPDAESVLRTIENPMPVWRQRGFESRDEVRRTIEGFG